METCLHQQLKRWFFRPGSQLEYKLGAYRIDVASEDELVEIQHGGLGVIQKKISDLVQRHHVRIVKPIIATKTIVKLDGPDGECVSRRLSPKRGDHLSIFQELVHFTKVFPHPRLTIEVVLVDVEEIRVPVLGANSRRRRRWKRSHEPFDQRLTRIRSRFSIRSPYDLVSILGIKLPSRFDTGILATLAAIPRWQAQQVAYCLRAAGAIAARGKSGRSILYRRTTLAG